MEYHGDEDRLKELTDRELEVALEEVVECVLDHGQWPQKGRAKFDLYEFLLEERDPSYALEMYVASMSNKTDAFADRIERERKSVEKMLLDHLQDSDMVRDHAMEDGE